MRHERSDDEVRMALLSAARPTGAPDPMAMVTVSETAQLSGVPGSTLAYHFDTPDELREAVFAEIVNRFDAAPSIALHENIGDAVASGAPLVAAISSVVDALEDHLLAQPATRWVLAAASRPAQQALAADVWRRHGADVARTLELVAASRRLRFTLAPSTLARASNVALVNGWLRRTFGEQPESRLVVDGEALGGAAVLLWARVRRFVERRP